LQARSVIFFQLDFSLRQEEFFFLFTSWDVRVRGLRPDALGFLFFQFPFRRHYIEADPSSTAVEFIL
jgi:hypothetical protein